MARLIEITGKCIPGEWGDEDVDGTGIPVLRTTNFTNEGVVNYQNVITRRINKRNLDKKYLRKGDIILEKSGGSDSQPVGRVIYFEGTSNTFLFNNFTGLLRVENADKWFPKYVFYALFAAYQRGETRAFENKTTGLHNLKLDSYMSSIEIAEIPYEDQVRIVREIDKVGTLISFHRQQLAKLDELVKSRFIELFGDLKSNPHNWQYKNLLDVADIDTVMVSDYEKYADYPHIGIDSIEKNTGRLFGYRTIAEDGVISGKYLFTARHIIYSKIRPNLNKVALPDFDGLCSADAYPILPKENVCLRIYLGYVMRSEFFLDYILPFSRRANMPKVNKEQLSGFNLPVPDIELQRQFAAFVEQTDKSKLAIQESLAKMEMLKKSLMQQYFG